MEEKSEKVAILKTLSRKSYLYCFIGLQMTKFKKIWHNFMKKWAFLACFSSIFPLNKEKKWRKNWKSRPGRTFKILGGQPSISVNFYPIFKILFFSESCWQGQLLGGQAAPPPVPPALWWRTHFIYEAKSDPLRLCSKQVKCPNIPLDERLRSVVKPFELVGQKNAHSD